jgi:mannosyl-oligosaccharide glucosidase
MGYFYGDSKVDRSHALEYEEIDALFWDKAAEARSRNSPVLAPAAELLTFVPSRPFFPRGFLWDEGFHLLLILDFDMDLAMEIVTSWLSRMDEDGWIAREQILGPEARSKVPPEFQTQYPHYANPPTLYLVVVAFINRVSGKVPYHGSPSKYMPSQLPAQPQVAKDFISQLYPLLKRHYDWFRRSQQGNMKSYIRPGSSANEGYRWRGRTPQHTLTSGLDDYPRAIPPHPGELHIDAISWVGLMAGAMGQFAGFIGSASANDIVGFADQERTIKRSIEELHWSEGEMAYCDATVVETMHELVCHKGYLSLFPFLLGLMGTTNPHLSVVLDLIRDENELWSPYGLRSLSRNSKFYGTDENYWRGPVWININYLALEQLLVRLSYHLYPIITGYVLTFVEIGPVTISTTGASPGDLHVPPSKSSNNRLQILGNNQFCMGTIQPRKWSWPEDPTFHRMDRPSREDTGDARSGTEVSKS